MNTITLCSTCDFYIVCIDYIVISNLLCVLLTRYNLGGLESTIILKPWRCHSGKLLSCKLHSHVKNTQFSFWMLYFLRPDPMLRNKVVRKMTNTIITVNIAYTEKSKCSLSPQRLENVVLYCWFIQGGGEWQAEKEVVLPACVNLLSYSSFPLNDVNILKIHFSLLEILSLYILKG